jgi:lipopolysaccharide transport system ATP-binding protein
MPQAVAVSGQGISKSFALVDAGNAWRLLFGTRNDVPKFEALSNVSFEVPKGKFVGVLGRNGAGKSTLLRVTGGAYAADSGRVFVNGKLSALYELGVVASPELTGRQYAHRLLTVHGFSSRERDAMVDDIQDFSELGDRFDDPVLTYSSGMGARLYFATATAGNYAVYLLDEVLSVGDQHFQAKCWRRMRERVSNGASGILVTHDWASVLKLCEVVYVLDRGKVVFSGPAQNAIRYYLYGETQEDLLASGIAQFVGQPQYRNRVEVGEDFVLSAEAEVLVPEAVGFVFAIERLQPGFGWEISFMSRHVTVVGAAPGHHEIRLSIPSLPLEPGHYYVNIHLVTSKEGQQERVALDGFGWLNGTGLPLEVTGKAENGLVLQTAWSARPS